MRQCDGSDIRQCVRYEETPLIRHPPFRTFGLFLVVLVLIACGTDARPADATQPASTYIAVQQNTPSARATPSPSTARATQAPSTPTALATPPPSAAPARAAEATTIPMATIDVLPTSLPSASAFSLTPVHSTPSTSAFSPTPVPSPTPPVVVEYDALSGPEQVEILGESAMQTLAVLTADTSPRSSAAEEERAAAQYLRREFALHGYDAWLQTFDVRAISPYERLLTIVEPQTLDIFAFPMWTTAEGQVAARVVDAGAARLGEIPVDGLAGSIAIIERGDGSFDEKVSRVAAVGAIGGIVYNNEPGPFVGALTEESIPVVSISQEDGERIKALMEDAPVIAALDLVYTEHSQNVIADKPGASDQGSVVVLGGHYDTVPNVPGANDNGSGIAVLLTIAREIAGREYPFTVRFIAFGAEELGLFGSRYYVDRLSDGEIAATIAMVNFDALGSGPVTTAFGSPNLLHKVSEYADERGIDVATNSSLIANIGSDHAPFEEAGIPFIFFMGEDLSRIHTPDDKLQFVDAALLGTSAALGIALLDILANEQ